MRSTRQGKPERLVTYKPVASGVGKLPVTSVTPTVGGPQSTRYQAAPVTGEKGDSPKRRYKLLKPWLDVANEGVAHEVTGPVLRLDSLTVGLLDDECPLFEQVIKASFDSLCMSAEHYRSADPDWAARWRKFGKELRDKGPGVSLAPWLMPEDSLISRMSMLTRFRLDLDGFLRDDPEGLRQQFERALVGAELDRFRRCGICSRFFYAVRRGQKACSTKCATVLRVRNWRANRDKYEQSRKLKSAGVKPAKEKK